MPHPGQPVRRAARAIRQSVWEAGASVQWFLESAGAHISSSVIIIAWIGKHRPSWPARIHGRLRADGSCCSLNRHC